MTDHLADARACIQSAAQAPDPEITISWLTATCEQIIAHLEARQASPQPATAPPAAQQGDSGHGDGGEAARPNLNAQTGYTPTTDEVEHRYAYDELYSMDCEADHHAFRRWLAAHDAEVRAQALNEAADKIHVSLQQIHKRAGRTLHPMFSARDQGLWDGYKNAENWLRARAEQTKEDR